VLADLTFDNSHAGTKTFYVYQIIPYILITDNKEEVLIPVMKEQSGTF